MDDFYKEEIVAKAATDSLKALDMIMQVVKDSKNGLVCPNYQSFLKIINDPKNAHIKEILDRTKSAVLSNNVEREELRSEVGKQREDLRR